MPPIKSFGERIADALVEDGLLSAKQVEEPVAVRIEEVLALGARPDAVEADRLQHAHAAVR